MTDDTAPFVAGLRRFRSPLTEFMALAITASNDPDAEAEAWSDWFAGGEPTADRRSTNRSTMPNDPPTKATTIAATDIAISFGIMLILIGVAAVIWAL